MVEIEGYQIVSVIVFGFVGVYTFQWKLWKKVCAHTRIAKRLHPKEAEIEGL